MIKGIVFILSVRLRSVIWCLSLMLSACIQGNAQASKEKTISQIISSQPFDTVGMLKVIQSQYAAAYLDRNLSIGQLDTILMSSRAAGFTEGVFFALISLGAEFQIRGDYNRSMDFLLKALPYLNKGDNSDRANIVYNNLGLTQSSLGNYEQALKYYYRSLEIMGDTKKTFNNGTDSSGVYNNIAVLWARQEELTYASDVLEVAKKIAQRKHDSIRLALTYNNLASVYELKTDLKQAELYYDSSLTIARKAHIPSIEITALCGLASLSKQQKKYSTAIYYLELARAGNTEKRTSAYTSVSILIELGDIYLAMNNYQLAANALETALTLTKTMKQKELSQRIEPRLAAAYASMGNYKDAYHQIKDYMTVRDSLFRQEKAKSFEVLSNSKIAVKDKEMLAKELFIFRQKNQLQQQKIWIGGTVIGSLLLLLAGLVLVRNYRHKQSAQQALICQMQQMQEIDQLKAQMRGEEQERVRIAHELHNGIASQLWGIRIGVDSLRQIYKIDERHDRQLGIIFHQLTETSQDVRKTAHNLMPDLLDEGLAAAIGSLCEKTKLNTNLDVEFLDYGTIPVISKEIELSIYRMVQELIQNVLKHAKDATYLLVQISCVGTLLNITVEDNGTALLAGQPKNEGMGIRQIANRVSAMKGHFDLQKSEGEGTTAYLEFDLQYLL